MCVLQCFVVSSVRVTWQMLKQLLGSGYGGRLRAGILGYPADGVDHTLSKLIFNRVLNAARYSSPIPMLPA
jgi:hypothetical protein